MTAQDHRDAGSLKLLQAKALIECLAITAKQGDEGVPYYDAAFGIIELIALAEADFENAASEAEAKA